MKRFYFILISALVLLTTVSNAAITVKFKPPASWTAVSLYSWGPEVLGGWPGAALTQEEGWYIYTFDEAFTGANLIFNNAGAGEQTEDYVISSSTCLEAANTLNGNGKYDVTVVPCNTGGIEVKFIAPDSWTAVSLYTWGPEALGGWPGAALTLSEGWYTYTFDAGFTGANLIFNNAGAGQQTEDYTISSSVCLKASNTLNGNGKYDVTVISCTTGIGENALPGVNIYPNPVKDFMSITADKKISNAAIFSITGQQLINYNEIPQNNALDVRSLNAGVYFVHITFMNGTISLQKIVKE